MKHVRLLWLRYFQAAVLVIDLVVIGLYVYQLFSGSVTPADHNTSGASHGIHTSASPITQIPLSVMVLAVIHAVYVLGFVWWLDKRKAWWTHAPAVFLAGVMVTLLTGIDTPMHNGIHILLIVFMFFAAMVGPFVPGVIFAVAFTQLIISSLGHLTTDPSGHVIEMVMVSLSGVTATVGWYIFSKRYVQRADTELVQSLTKVVSQEKTTVDLLLESIVDGVMIVNTKGNVQVLNTSLARMVGWPKNEAQNLDYKALLESSTATEKTTEPTTQPSKPPQQTSDLALTKTMKTGKTAQAVSLIKTRDGRQVYLDIAASPIYQAEKMVGIIAVARDVDKQKREEQARTEFISTASHEMRTPVAAIEGYLALAMNDRVSTIDAKARSYLEKAHESTQHLGKLFQDLLTSTKAEDGRLSNHPSVIEMGQYLERLVESLKFGAEKKGLFMEFIIGTASPETQSALQGSKVVRPLYYIHADPDRIQEVITNIFDNAVKYTTEGKISIGLTGNDQVVQLYVRDTGPGIPPTDIPHLFQKFYRVDSSATRTIGGTGLGLFICRKIIELYNGRIWAESEIKKGSTFYINLPRLSTQRANELQTAESAQAANTSALDQS